jgi:hypothetical protein
VRHDESCRRRTFKIRLCPGNHGNAFHHFRTLIHESTHFRNECFGAFLDCTAELKSSVATWQQCMCARQMCDEIQSRIAAGECTTIEKCLDELWQSPAYRNKGQCAGAYQDKVLSVLLARCNTNVPRCGQDQSPRFGLP